jgi:ATP-dependent Zn protease
MGRFSKSRGLLYFMILMVLVVILVRMFSLGSSNVKELNSQQFLTAVHNHEFVTNPANPDNQLTVHDQSQEVTGELRGGQQFAYYYPHNYHIAAVLNKAETPFVTDAQTNGIWLTLIGSLAPILLIVLFFILFMGSMRGDGNRIMSFGKSRVRRMTKDQPKVTFSDVAGAAEKVVFDEITTGASNDLERVTQTARQMVTRFGMSEKLGPMALGHQQGQVFMGRDFNNQPDYSDEIAFQIDKEIRRIVDESYDTAEDVLVRNRELLDKLSAELIEYETVDANHLKRLIEEYAAGPEATQRTGTTTHGKESP